MLKILKHVEELGIVSNRVAIFVSEVSLLALMLITAYAVIARYIFLSPSVHAVEVSTYLLLVITWSSVGWVHHMERHVSMEALNTRLKGAWKVVADIISELTILMFCGVLLWAGTNVAITALMRDYRSSTLLKYPMWFVYSLIPIGGCLLALIAIRRLRHVVKTPSTTAEMED